MGACLPSAKTIQCTLRIADKRAVHCSNSTNPPQRRKISHTITSRAGKNPSRHPYWVAHRVGVAPVFVLTAAGPDNATMVPSYLTYYHFFTTQRVGYGAAIAVVQMILTVALAVIFLRFQARQQATE